MLYIDTIKMLCSDVRHRHSWESGTTPVTIVKPGKVVHMLLKAEQQTSGMTEGLSVEAKHCCCCCSKASEEAWVNWIFGYKILLSVVVK